MGEAPTWGTCLVQDGVLKVYEDGDWQVLNLTDETNLRLIARCINELSTYREVAPHDTARHNKAMKENSALRAALTEALDALVGMNTAYVNARNYHEERTDTLYEVRNEQALKNSKAFLAKHSGTVHALHTPTGAGT